MGKRNKLPPKSHSQRIHAKKRAEERFGVALNRHDLRDIVEQIEDRSAFLVCKQSHRVSVYVVNLKGYKAFAVYDRNRKTVVTFLKEYGDNNITPELAIRQVLQTRRQLPMWAEWD